MKNIIRLLKTKVDLSGKIGSCFTDIELWIFLMTERHQN